MNTREPVSRVGDDQDRGAARPTGGRRPGDRRPPRTAHARFLATTLHVSPGRDLADELRRAAEPCQSRTGPTCAFRCTIVRPDVSPTRIEPGTEDETPTAVPPVEVLQDLPVAPAHLGEPVGAPLRHPDAVAVAGAVERERRLRRLRPAGRRARRRAPRVSRGPDGGRGGASLGSSIPRRTPDPSDIGRDRRAIESDGRGMRLPPRRNPLRGRRFARRSRPWCRSRRVRRRRARPRRAPTP